MAECTNSEWTININLDGSPGVYETLFFRLTITQGVITGEVFIGSVKLSNVSGSCQPFTVPDATVMTLTFSWEPVDIFLVGFTHFVFPLRRFKGRFMAFPSVILEKPADERVLRGPDPGDTGTGTGQQT